MVHTKRSRTPVFVKKFVILAISMLIISACSLANQSPTEEGIETITAYTETVTATATETETVTPLPPQGISFRHLIIDDMPNTGADCCTDVAALGDINGDGFLDVVIGAEHAPTDGLVWYAYPDWTKYAVGDGDYTTDGETADLDRDGDIDIVISSISRNEIVWWENAGDPTQKNDWLLHTIGQSFVHDIEVGDVNGDGFVDVVSKSKEGAGILGLYLAPENPAEAWRFIQIDTIGGEGLAIGDLDGDGDLDVGMSHYWYENFDGDGLNWQRRNVTETWGQDARVVIKDMNQDGKNDIILSHSEGNGRIAWFENPAWVEHPIDSAELGGVHSLDVGDFNLDGLPDVFAGQMHTSREKQVVVYINVGNGAWDKILLAETGTHNARIGDIDQDGDPDIVGKNYGGENRVIEFWQNYIIEAGALQDWKYIPIDDNRPDSQMGMMGLVFSDVNQDGYADIIAGSYLYINPEGQLDEPWNRSELPENIDVYFSVNVDDDDSSDLIGISNSRLVWIEYDPTIDEWKTFLINTVPGGRTQGYTLAQIIPGGKPEIVFTRAKNLFYVEIPSENPENGKWPMVQVSSSNEEEGVFAGDIDRDGDLDLTAQDEDGHHVVWFENPGDNTGNWTKYQIGSSQQWLDRIALTDINTDGRLDVIVTEETQDRAYNARIYWFSAPEDPKSGKWIKHIIDIWRSVNSMDIVDMDHDGDVDIVVAEHTDNNLGRWKPTGEPDNATLWYENLDNGNSWIPHFIEIGPHSSHLGARVNDLDNDGDFDVVSTGWMQFKKLHLWENFSVR